MRPLFAVVLLVAFSFGQTIESAQAQVGAAELGGVLIALQNLRANLDSVVNTVDAETAARIHQVEVVLDTTIANVKDAMDHGYGLVNNTRDQVMGNVAAALNQSNALIQDTGEMAFLDFNDSLVNVSRILTAIPAIKVPTYVFAVRPTRLPPDAADRLIEVYGFFPDLSSAHPASVLVAGSTIPLKESVGNGLTFEIPATALKQEGTFVNLTFVLPEKHFISYGTKELAGRLYVETKTPFKFDVKIYGENPDAWASVTAPPLIERADSSRTSNNQTLTAPEVFSRLINDDTNYEMSTAKFTALSQLPVPAVPPQQIRLGLALVITIPGRPAGTMPFITAGSSPCDGCDASTGSGPTWNERTVAFALSAPTCGGHMVSRPFPEVPYYCGGGGTHAEFQAIPTFKVRRRNAPPEAVLDSKAITMGRHAIDSSFALPKNWTSVEITGHFKDGKEHYDKHVRMTGGPNGIHTAHEPIFWSADAAGQSLVLETK